MTVEPAGWLPSYQVLAQYEAGMRGVGMAVPAVAVYPRYLVHEARSLKSGSHTFCFIGSVGAQIDRRGWVREFASAHFDEQSIYCDTSKEPSAPSLGSWDISGDPSFSWTFKVRAMRLGTPRNDPAYWTAMASSQYVPCPVGDLPWSLRTYECFMLGCVPVVEKVDDLFRNEHEEALGMECVLASEWEPGCGTGIAERNWKRFQKHHMLPERVKEAS